MAVKTMLGIDRKVLVLQDTNKSMSDHMLHSFTDITSEKDGSLTSGERGFLPGLRVGIPIASLLEEENVFLHIQFYKERRKP
jgi:hypothetical protein